MKQEIFHTTDGNSLECTLWNAVKNPRGVVQIIHGLGENVNRYDRFARFLNQNGFIVFGTAQRMRGPDTFMTTTRDELEIMQYLKDRYDLPLFLFGRGYGAFITQRLISDTKICTGGVCLSDAGKYPKSLLAPAIVAAWIGMKIHGPDSPAKFLRRIFPLGTKPRRKTPPQGKHFTYGFYYSLLKNLARLDDTAGCPGTPLLIISGAHGRPSLNETFAKSLYNAYKSRGMENLTLIFYPDTGQDMLHELNYADIQNDILQFFNAAI